MQLNNEQQWTIARLAYWYLQRGRYEEAESLFRGLLSLNQRNGLAWQYYGQVRLKQDDLQEASRAFGEAARLLEDRADVWMQFGSTLLRQGRIQDARKALSTADNHADDPELRQRIGVLLRRVG